MATIASLLAVDAAAPATQAHTQALTVLDAFLSRASSVQTRRTSGADDAFRADGRAVFQLYMQLLPFLQQIADADASLPPDSLAAQALHVTRVVPFCQVFGPRNADAVQQLLRALVDADPAFRSSLAALRGVCCQRFEHLHRAVARAKQSEEVVELTLSLYEMSLSLWGVASPSTTELLFLDGKNAEEDLAAQESSLAFALVRCYELDLPRLQRQLTTLDNSQPADTLAVVADTRRVLLQVFGAYLDLLMEMETTSDQQGDSSETLLAVLHSLTHCSDSAELDGGSFLSDLWLLCGLKTKVADYFTRHEMDAEQLEYLEMIVDGLPRRRIVPKEEATSSSKQKEPRHLEREEKQSATADSTSNTAELAVLVDQVKDFFPDLGDGFIELCLLSSKRQVEVVINFLLESNPPPDLLDVPQSLSKSDAEFERIKTRMTGTAPPASSKLDPSQVWVGKKPMEKEYDPQIGKKDQQLADKMKQIVAQYEDEDKDELVVAGGVLPGVITVDEYDDDYNDEFEDYQPFSVHDGGQLDDQEAIRDLNRRIRAKEEEDAFWESMKNPNHRILPDDEDEDGDGEEKAGDKRQQSGAAGDAKPQGPRPNGPPKKAGDKKKGGGKAAADDKQEKEAPTPQQQQRARARSNKNKAKVANHHRKERALKKMG